MKVKSIMIAAFATQLSTSCLAQTGATKAETEQWILSKLKKYGSGDYNVYTNLNANPRDILFDAQFKDVKNTTFDFDGTSLIVTYQEVRKYGTSSYRVSIPVYNIKDVYCFQDNNLVITTKDEVMTEKNVTDNTTKVENYFSTFFTCKAETDLPARLKKAFDNLKKFYKKPVNKELF